MHVKYKKLHNVKYCKDVMAFQQAQYISFLLYILG